MRSQTQTQKAAPRRTAQSHGRPQGERGISQVASGRPFARRTSAVPPPVRVHKGAAHLEYNCIEKTQSRRELMVSVTCKACSASRACSAQAMLCSSSLLLPGLFRSSRRPRHADSPSTALLLALRRDRAALTFFAAARRGRRRSERQRRSSGCGRVCHRSAAPASAFGRARAHRLSVRPSWRCAREDLLPRGTEL